MSAPKRICTCERVHRGKPWGAEHDNTCWPCWSYYHIREQNLAQGGDGTGLHEWLPEAKRPVSFDPPPPITLSPNSPRAIVTVAAGPKGEELLEISGPGLRDYAERCGADLVVLRPPANPRFPCAVKWYAAPVLDWYERIAWIDADTIVRPAADNIFDEVPPGCFGVVDELRYVLRSWPGLLQSYQTDRESQGLDRAIVPHYFNAGVYVCDREHKAALATPAHPCRVTHCLEQNLLNAMVESLKIPVHLMPEKWNYQWWPRQSFDGAPPDALLHFSGIFDHGERLERMRAASRSPA